MNDRDRFLDLAAELARAAQESARHGRHRHRARHRRTRGSRNFMRWLNAVLLMLSSAIIIPVVAVSLGLLFGRHWYEGLIATPVAVLAAWALILFSALRKRVTRRMIERADIAQLPEQTAEWLERQRARLPFGAQSTLESIAVNLEALAPQVKGLDANVPEAVELRRLIGEELTALVEGYQKLPEALRRQPLHGGPSPEQRLLDGLATIDSQLSRVHHRLAEGDLYRLATHQRYLELKYDEAPPRSAGAVPPEAPPRSAGAVPPEAPPRSAGAVPPEAPPRSAGAVPPEAPPRSAGAVSPKDDDKLD